ncbi:MULTISPECIES: ABC transporter permease [Natrialbaceae]|uniref:ABC transporter permease n=1 Tax=Natrialbaceae TaxID=1644061 RepID=UPI00207C39A8|nr:ABC transporter permease [Natronococcus sp. CG52]
MSLLGSAFGRLERVVHMHGRRFGYATILFAIVFLWTPIFVLVIMSFAKHEVLTFPPQSFTTDWYVVFLNNDQAISSVLTSLKVSLVATPIAVVLALLISYSVDRYDFVGNNTLQLLATLPIVVPLVVVGVALAIFLGIVNFPSGYWSVVIAHVIRILPFATLIILPTFVAFDYRLEEASKDLGADELQTFVRITLPNIFPGIVAGGLLAFTISFNEFVYTYFVKDTVTNTLPTYLWDELRQHATPEVNVISVVFIIVAVTIVLLAVTLTHVERIATYEE